MGVLRVTPAAMLKNFERPYLCNRSSNPFHVWFYGRVSGVGRSNGATSSWTKSKMAAGCQLGKFLHVWFKYRVFGVSTDWMALLPANRRWSAALLKNFEKPYLSNGSLDPLHVWFHGRVIGVGRSNGATSGWSKSEMEAGCYIEKFRMAISQQWFTGSTSCLVPP